MASSSCKQDVVERESQGVLHAALTASHRIQRALFQWQELSTSWLCSAAERWSDFASEGAQLAHCVCGAPSREAPLLG